MLSIMKVGMCIMHIGYKSLCVHRLCLCVKLPFSLPFYPSLQLVLPTPHSPPRSQSREGVG